MPSADPFKLKPIDLPNDFVWSGKNFHVTYPGHVSMEACLSAAHGLTSIPLLGYSHVQEIAKHDDGSEYHHTHLGLMYSAPIKVQGCHKMDARVVDDNGFPDYIHPQVIVVVDCCYYYYYY